MLNLFLHIFKVLVDKLGGKTKIHVATDFKEPLILHWALSKKAGEWLVRIFKLLTICIVFEKMLDFRIRIFFM